MEKKYDLAVIGSSGFIGKSLSSSAKKEGFSVLEITSSTSRVCEDEVAVWKYDISPPGVLSKASIIINCAYSWKNKKPTGLVENILDSLRPEQKLIHISTYATRTGLTSLSQKILFSGDDYIREKRKMDRYLRKNLKKNRLAIVYPTVVLGPGGSWQNFFDSIEGKIVHIPHGGNVICKKISIDDLSDKIIASIKENDLGKLRDRILWDEKRETWRNVVLKNTCNVTVLKNENTRIFYNSFLKNFVLSILCMRVLPDFLALRLFKFLRKKIKASNEKSSSCKTVIIEGMTRYYMAHE